MKLIAVTVLAAGMVAASALFAQAPGTTPVIAAFANGAELTEGASFAAAVTLTWTVSDTALDRISATLDDSAIASGHLVADPGLHILVVTAANASKSETLRRSFSIRRPELRILANGKPFAGGATFNGPVVFTLEASSSKPSGATIDGSPYTFGTTVTDEGVHVLAVTVAGSARRRAVTPPTAIPPGGGTAVSLPLPFTIDLHDPVVTLTESGQPFRDGMKFTRDVHPVVVATDNFTARPSIGLILDGQPLRPGEPIVVESRDHTIAATATDDGGNAASTGPFHFVLDKTRPVVAITDGEGKPFAEAAVFAQPVLVRVSVRDISPTTVVATLNGAPLDLGQGVTQSDGSVVFISAPIAAGGSYKLSVAATDDLGLVSDAVTAAFVIEQVSEPMLAFLAPAPNAVIDATTVVVRGSAGSAVAVTVNDVPATLDAGTKTFTARVTLTEGVNSLVAKGIDSAGLVGIATLGITADTRAPDVTIAAPASNACLNGSEVVVRGRAVDPHLAAIAVSVAGRAAVVASVAADHTWSAVLPLPGEGRSVIDVEARDSLGHAASVAVPVVVDRTRPAIDVSVNGASFAGGAFNHPLAVSVRVIDSDPLSAMTVTLNGSPYVPGTEVRAEGSYSLAAAARDCAGNASDDVAIGFRIDTTPLRIMSVDPADGSAVGSERAIVITVDADDAREAAIEDTVYAATISGRRLTFDGVRLAEGTNRFVVVVRDVAGNVTRQTYSLRLKSTVPSVEIVEDGSPIAPDALYNRPVTPVVRSNEAGATISATLNGAPFASGTVVAGDGAYALTARADDAYGHSSRPATATFAIDRTPPAISVSAIVDNDHAAVSGRVSGGDVERVTVNQFSAVLTDGAFQVSVPLDVGLNTLVATAIDHAGNVASARVDVTRADDRPGLILTSPEDGMVTNRPTTVVAGQLLTPGTGAHVTINGIDVPAGASGAFRRDDFALVEGDNAITAAIAGTSRAVTVHVIADFTPPAIRVLVNGSEMNAGARYASSPAITLQAADNDPKTTTRLIVDGIAITGAVPVLKDGGHALTAVARDTAGNETRVERAFFIDGSSVGGIGCGLSNFDPPNNATVFTPSIKIAGRSGGAAAVLVNGARAQVAEGSFTASVNLTQEGVNTLTIACADLTGTPTSDPPVALTLYRSIGAPSIAIESPARETLVTQHSVTVSGTVGGEVVAGDVNGIGFTPAGGRFSIPNIALANGLNVVTARARNDAGRIGIATVVVTLAAGAPRINITSPLPWTETGAAAIDVSGTYIDADPSGIRVTAGGTPYAVTTRPLGDTSGTFIAPVVPLAPNTTTTITANVLGTQAAAAVDVKNAAGAPSINITSPVDDTFYRSDQSAPDAVSGTISSIAGSTVQVNGVQASVDGTFHFRANVPFSEAANGVTPIIARVTAPDGKSASDSIRIVRFPAALTVKDTFPAAEAQGVDAGAVMVILFSNPLDAATARTALTLSDDSGQTITGITRVDRDAVAFAPQVPLPNGKRYTLTVTQSLKDLAGGALSAPFALRFTTSSTAPPAAPLVNESDKSGCLTRETITGMASTGGARVRLDLDGVPATTIAAGDGAFRFDFGFNGRPGFHIARVREVGGDGSLSPERDVCYRVNCAGPQVVGASLDRTSKTLTVQFSKPMTASTLVASPGGSILLGSLSGTVAVNAEGDVATVTYSADLSAGVFTLTITREAKDLSGAPLTAEYVQTFVPQSDPQRPKGSGIVSGAVYDETTGRPLAGASVTILPAQLTAITDEHGRYSRSVPEGAYTIESGAAATTTVWRQVIVAAGAVVVPVDIRITRRGRSVTTAGDVAISDIGDPVATRQVELAIPSASLPAGRRVQLTSISAQSLAGLLPLGWSPLAAAEIAIDIPSSIPAARLTFVLTAADVSAIAAANQSLSLVQYDPVRDEWRVVVAVVAIDANRQVISDVDASGNYALVYPDKAPSLAHPPLPQAGAVLAGVANICAVSVDACAMTGRRFDFDPPLIAPNGRALATLVTDGAARPFPSGTAVQATIDEQLNLADGRVLIDPPFATDLLVYRNLAGDAGAAMFHIAPTSQASAVTLRDGADHVRIVDYPGRLDRGALIGAEGGKVSGGGMAIDIPSGATLVPLHAAVTPMTASELAPFTGRIAGFNVAGGFALSLTRSDDPPPVDLNGDGIPDPTPVSLFKPARGTFTVDAAKFPTANRQVVIAEVLSSAAFGTMARLAATTSASPPVFVTKAVDPAQLPMDGIVREGRYLILTSDVPIAFAWGQVRNGLGGTVIANARVTASPLGMADVTRPSGIFAIPVVARPAAPFSLRAGTPARGDGTPATFGSSPDPDASVRLDIVLDAQPPHLVTITPRNTERDASDPLVVQVTFDTIIDRASVRGEVTVTNSSTAAALSGIVDAAGNVVSFTPSEPLRPASRYEIKVLPAIRGANGAPFGQTATAQFSTRALPGAAGNIHPERVQITLPQNGVSTIRGTSGALPPHGIALAVRRQRNFVTQYQKEVDDDGSFSFTAGSLDEVDRVTTADLIDLHVIDPISHAEVAVIALTPFITAEGDGFLAPAGVTTSFVTASGIGITVPSAAFDTPTVVRAQPAARSVFEAVTAFNDEMRFAGGVHVDFDGVARERLELDIPAAGALDPAKSYYLGRLIDTARGPRIEIDDFLRVDGGKLTTRLPPGSANAPASVRVSALSRTQGIPGLTTAGEVKHAALGVVQRGDYGSVDIIPPIGWAFLQNVGEGLDLLVNTIKSAGISGFWLSQKSGKALMPVLANQPFTMTGIDSTTGLTIFTKTYDAQVPAGDPLSGVQLPAPQQPSHGPYPTFSALGRVEVIDVNASSFTDTSRRGLAISFDQAKGLLTVSPSSGVSIAASQPVEVYDVNDGAMAADDSFSKPLSIASAVGHRVLVTVGESDVDPLVNISVVFSEPIETTGPLRSHFAIEVGDASNRGAFSPITSQATFRLDSGDRRVTASFPAGLQRGRRYRVTARQSITGTVASGSGKKLGLGEVDDGAAGVNAPPHDFRFDFTTRPPGGDIGSFTLASPFDPTEPPGTARDFALHGNILFAAATTAGLLAFDAADPAALARGGKPFAWAPVNPAVSDTWSVATDRHGRVWATSLTNAFGVIRGYTADAFVEAGEKANASRCSPSNPADCPVPPSRGALIVSYRPGFLEALPLSSSSLTSDFATTLTTKPEAIPRKMQVVAQDVDGPSLNTEDLAKTLGASVTPISGSDSFVRVSLAVGFDAAGKYYVQRVTVRNVTLGLEWSKDILRHGSATFEMIGRTDDRWVKTTNYATYGVVNLFGFGIGVYDLNALESNRWNDPADPNPDNNLEQILISDAKYRNDCSGSDPPQPPDPFNTGKPFDCDPYALATIGKHCPVPDLALSAESVVLPGAAPQFVVYGLSNWLGLVEFPINPPVERAVFPGATDPTCSRGYGLTLKSRVPWPTIAPPGTEQKTVDFDHPRLNRLRTLYGFAAEKLNAQSPPKPFVRFSAIALYTRRTGDSITNYGLIASGSYGLLVVRLDPATPLDDDSLVDVVWIPAGAYSVRTVPGAALATVTDGAGRVLVVDLSAIDESGKVEPLSSDACVNPDHCEAPLFPTAEASITLPPAPPVKNQNWTEIGAADPRIIWQSTADPNDLTRTTLAPVIDSETGILYRGDYLDPKVKITAAADPRIRFMADVGDPRGLVELGAITPMGIEPPAGLLKCQQGPRCNASAAIFRLEVSLPGAIADSLPGGELRLALESETFVGVPAMQTPAALPRSSLRQSLRDGTPDPRRTSAFALRRLLPSGSDPALARLRFQKAYNRFASPWVVTIADPRASEKFIWPNDVNRAEKGCFFCTRPPVFQNRSEPETFELYTAGRIIAARPEYATATFSEFSGTAYAYLAERGRMEARVPAVIADTIHPLDIVAAAENPPVAGGALQETTYLHSGELESSALDLVAGGRAGWNVSIDRTYRSRTIGMSRLGWGWDSSMFARLRELPNGTIEYRDGSGEVWIFVRAATGSHYTASGLPLKLVFDGRGWRIFDQQAHYLYFDQNGRIIARSDQFADPSRVMNDNLAGNVIRYLYDEQGRLSQIIDPVNRVTRVAYYPESSGASVGLVKEFTDWRQRKVTYEYDALGRLGTVRLPEAANAAVPAYDMTGGKRPFRTYEYSNADSAAYNDFLELAANLESITDPAEASGGNQRLPRVRFLYGAGTNPDQRDRVVGQTWPCASAVDGVCRERSATLLTTPASATVTDILGQVTKYEIRKFADGRHHIASATAEDVPIIAEAGAPQSAIAVTIEPRPKTIITSFDYDEWGNVTSVVAPDYTETNVYGSIGSVHPGKVLTDSVAGSSVKVHTHYAYDTLAVTGVQLFAVGREYGSDVNAPLPAAAFRAAPQAHHARLNLERAESGVATTVSGVDKAGLALQFASYPPGTSVPPTGALPAGETRKEERTIFPPTASEHARGRVRTSTRTDGKAASQLEALYTTAPSGGEIETVVDKARSLPVTTTITRDSMDRVIELTTDRDPRVHEKFGYDASGHLVHHSRQQDGLGEVVERFTFDPLGRSLSRSMDQAIVGGSAASVETTTSYDLAALRTTVTHPPNASGVRAQTVTRLDRLGRTAEVETIASGAATLKRVFGYDIHGDPAFESDSVRNATLVQHDSLGRQAGRIGTDGLSDAATFSAWDEVLDEKTLDGEVVVAHATHTYGDQGTPLRVNEEIASGANRATDSKWEEGGARIVASHGKAVFLGGPPAGDDVRTETQFIDRAGRVTRAQFRSGSSVFRDSETTEFDGDLPRAVTDTAVQRGSATFQSTIDYDALGHPTNVRAAGGYTTAIVHDQLGNPLELTPPGLGTERAAFDSRGLQTRRTIPGGTIELDYDAIGDLTRYTDQSDLTTLYERDAVGRVTKVTYPDSTYEQTVYEDGTGLVKATRDRAGQWLSYRYDSGNRLTEVFAGPDVTSPTAVRYEYDLPGFRLHRISNANAAIEYEDYDLLGRPGVTRSIRYGSDGKPSDVHVQRHLWSVFGTERTRWRMPAAGHDVPPSEPPSGWRTWVFEERDGGGKLTRQVSVLGATQPPAGFVISSTTSAGLAEIRTRTRNLTASTTPVVSNYDYRDAPVVWPTELGAGSFAGADADGALLQVETRRGAMPLAGTEVFRNESGRIGAAKDLGLGERGSMFAYDARGRLSNSKSHLRFSALSANTGTVESLTNADFRGARKPAPTLTASQHAALGSEALIVEPPVWNASERTGHQIDVRRILLDGKVVDERTYAFAGGRRTSDGRWTSRYDEFGRLVELTSDADKRRIVATYDPLNRIVGRTAYRHDGTGWVLEDRQPVLDSDGLPAATTLLWDPVVDRLVAIVEAGVSTKPNPPPDAGLIRQYVHGDRAYDDPVEILAIDGSAVKRYLPIVDEAGTGSLEAVLDGADGHLVERILYADAYGDAPRYIQGPVVDEITLDAAKDAAGALQEVDVHIHVTDALVDTTVASGVQVRAANTATSAGTATLDKDPHGITIKLTPAEWQSLTAASAQLEIAVTPTLRAEAWGDTPIAPAPSWAKPLYNATSTPFPVIKRESVAAINAFIAGAESAKTSTYPTTLYAIPDLYLAGSPTSVTKLFTGFKSAPFVEPTVGWASFRARWYDPTTGTFTTPDSIGYRDSSSLYCYAAEDPVGSADPQGTSAFGSWVNRTFDPLNDEGKQEVRDFLSGSLGALPLFGEATDIFQAATGYDPIADRTLTRREQAIAAAAIAIPLAGAAAARRAERAAIGGTERTTVRAEVALWDTSVKQWRDVRSDRLLADDIIQRTFQHSLTGPWVEKFTIPNDAFLVTMMGPSGLTYYIERKTPTFGGPGRLSWLAPLSDFAHATSYADVMRETGNASGVAAAVAKGETLYGLKVPRRGLVLRMPTILDEASNPHFRIGGFTGVVTDGVWVGNRTGEATVHGGARMPTGSEFFRVERDGSHTVLRRFLE